MAVAGRIEKDVEGMICKTCFYFRPYRAESIVEFRAICEHPDCFAKNRTQDYYGCIVYRDERKKNIADWVTDDDRCRLCTPFEITIEKRKFLGIIPYTVETKVIKDK